MTGSEPQPESDWNPAAPAVVADYMGAFAEMRAKCPVPWSDIWGGFWSLTTHRDIEHACRHPELFSNGPQMTVPNLDLGFKWLPLQSDAPDHAAYRSVLQPFLHRGHMREIEPVLRERARARLELLAAQGEVDAALDFAYPFAAEALCLAFNVSEEHWLRFRNWATDIVGAFRTVDILALQAVLADILAFVRSEVDARTADPGDDLMSALLAHRMDGRPLTEAELHGYFALLVSAGQNTASDSIGHAVNHFAHHPEHRALLRERPELVPSAVEEIVRYYPPLLALARNAAADVEIGGRCIHAGDQIAMVWASAARDETQYPASEEFIIDRPPTRSLSFGLGPHYCVGADLGRMQLRIAVEEILAAWPDFEVTGEPLMTTWPANGYQSLPITIRVSARTETETVRS